MKRQRKQHSKYRAESKTIQLLKTLGKNYLSTIELLDELFAHESTYKILWRSIHIGNPHYVQIDKERFTVIRSEKKQYHSLLNQLTNEGFIEKKRKGKLLLWRTTPKGKGKVRDYQQYCVSFQPGKKDGKVRIIIFDIPEELKRERDWLRKSLRQCDFKLLQKSVWLGKRKVPKALLDMLREKKLLKHIHILEITKTGTIRELK